MNFWVWPVIVVALVLAVCALSWWRAGRMKPEDRPGAADPDPSRGSNYFGSGDSGGAGM